MTETSLLVALQRATDDFRTNLGRVPQLVRFVDFPPHYLSRAKILDGLTSDDIRGWVYSFPDMRPYVEKYGPRNGYWRWFKSLRPKLKQLIYQQSLVFIVTSFEVFAKDAVKLVLQHVPSCLSSVRALKWKRVYELGFDGAFHANWAKMTEAFDTLFRIDLTLILDNPTVIEIFEIRHAIIHNLGIIDKRFINKIESSNLGLEYRVGDMIQLDEKALEHITTFILLVASALQKKLSKVFVLEKMSRTELSTDLDEEFIKIRVCTPDKCPFCGGDRDDNIMFVAPNLESTDPGYWVQFLCVPCLKMYESNGAIVKESK